MRTIERLETDEESGQFGPRNIGKCSPELGPSPAWPVDYRGQLHDAIAALYRLFDEAWERINVARPEVGSPDLIAGESREGGRVYSERGYHGSLRTLSLFPVVPRSDSDHFGGVYVTPSGAAGPLYLVPSPTGDPVEWRVLRTWEPFTAQNAEDMFLAVFEADAGADRRLAQLYRSDPAVQALR